MLTKFLQRRQLTGEKLKIINAVPIRKTRFVCLQCHVACHVFQTPRQISGNKGNKAA